MANETPREESPLVVNEDQRTRTSSLRGLKQAFFVAASAGAFGAIVPTVMGAISGNTEVYPSVLTAAFAGVALAAGALKYLCDSKGKSNCATNTILIGLQGFATAAAEVASVAGLAQTPNALTGMAVVGGAVMNGSVVASAALNCVR